MIVEPSNRSDEWAWQARDANGVIVGLFRSHERGEAWAAGNVALPQGHTNQSMNADQFGKAA